MPRIPRATRLLCASLSGLLMTVSGHAADWSHAEKITVVMVDNRFQPDHVTFEQDETYDLHLENHGKDMHEFTAPAFLKAATIRDAKLLANGGTDIVVQPRQTVDIFLVAPAKGQYSLICADHDWDGMTGSITVGGK
jgi:uncharacterized cupredoxin-like copper-binding protein